MTLLDALAAALRDRLLAGHAAPLPGVGTLRRERVAARVEPQADGSSLLLPPSETVAFEPGPASSDDALATGLLQHLGTPDADPSGTLRRAIDQLEAHLAASGEVGLPGIGTMHRTDAGVAFAAAPDLLAAVGRPYDGLTPVSTQATDDTVLRVPTATAPTEASFIDEDTLDDDLDDVLESSAGASESPSLRAVLPLTPPEEQAPAADAPTPEEASVPEAELPVAPTGAADLESDDTNEWSILPGPPADASPETPPEPAPLPTDELVPSDATPPPASPTDPSDLEWLEAYDSDVADPEPEKPEPAGIGGTPVATTSPASTPPLPKPPPIIAGPVDPPPKRGVPFWAWMLIPLALLAALFFWYRSTQPSESSEPILTAELSPEDELARTAADSLADASAATVPDSTELASTVDASPDTSATASPAMDAAALDGEFPVEEMTGGAATSSTPAAAPVARPAPARPVPSASSTPASAEARIDRPDLSGLSDADREALTGTAPIVSGRGGFSWVVLSTRDRTPADLRARQYRQAGWRVRVFQTEALGATVYRLAIGQFTSREQADRLRPYLPSQVPADTWRLDLSTL